MHIFQQAFDTLLAKVDRLARKIIVLKRNTSKYSILAGWVGRETNFFYKKMGPFLIKPVILFLVKNLRYRGPKLHHRLKPGYTVLGPEGFGTIITEATDAL